MHGLIHQSFAYLRIYNCYKLKQRNYQSLYISISHSQFSAHHINVTLDNAINSYIVQCKICSVTLHFQSLIANTLTVTLKTLSM